MDHGPWSISMDRVLVGLLDLPEQIKTDWTDKLCITKLWNTIARFDLTTVDWIIFPPNVQGQLLNQESWLYERLFQVDFHQVFVWKVPYTCWSNKYRVLYISVYAQSGNVQIFNNQNNTKRFLSVLLWAALRSNNLEFDRFTLWNIRDLE